MVSCNVRVDLLYWSMRFDLRVLRVQKNPQDVSFEMRLFLVLFCLLLIVSTSNALKPKKKGRASAKAKKAPSGKKGAKFPRGKSNGRAKQGKKGSFTNTRNVNQRGNQNQQSEGYSSDENHQNAAYSASSLLPGLPPFSNGIPVPALNPLKNFIAVPVALETPQPTAYGPLVDSSNVAQAPPGAVMMNPLMIPQGKPSLYTPFYGSLSEIASSVENKPRGKTVKVTSYVEQIPLNKKNQFRSDDVDYSKSPCKNCVYE